jgi:hypothetical protein
MPRAIEPVYRGLKDCRFYKRRKSKWSRDIYIPVTIAALFVTVLIKGKAIPVAARCKASAFGRAPAGVVGAKPTKSMMCVCCECYVLPGSGLCNSLITRPEESYRVWCASACGRES